MATAVTGGTRADSLDTRQGAADRGEYRQAAGANAKAVTVAATQRGHAVAYSQRWCVVLITIRHSVNDVLFLVASCGPKHPGLTGSAGLDAKGLLHSG